MTIRVVLGFGTRLERMLAGAPRLRASDGGLLVPQLLDD